MKHPLLKLDSTQDRKLGAAARRAGVHFIRVFGSASHPKSNPRDIDLVVGPKMLTVGEQAELTDHLSNLFGKPVEVVQLRPGVSTTLVLEIARDSIPIWEDKNLGRSTYAEVIDRFSSIARDERFLIPKKLQDESLRRSFKRLLGRKLRGA